MSHIFYVQTRLLHRENESNTAIKEASISDEADPITTCWLMTTHARVANTFTKKSAKLSLKRCQNPKRLPNIKKILFMCLVCEIVFHSPTWLYRQIVYTANIDGVWSWAV